MCTIKYDELEFDHIVEFTGDATIFAAARENGSGRIRLFLVNESTGNIYSRNGAIDSWELVCGDHRYSILARLTAARNRHIPVYRINGSQN
jgi:hypothetical protein